MLAQQRFHIRPGSKHAFGTPGVSTIHERIKHLQSMVAHAYRVGIGKPEAEFTADGPMVLDHNISLAAHVLRGRLHMWPNARLKEFSSGLIDHRVAMVWAVIWAISEHNGRWAETASTLKCVGHMTSYARELFSVE